MQTALLRNGLFIHVVSWNVKLRSFLSLLDALLQVSSELNNIHTKSLLRKFLTRQLFHLARFRLTSTAVDIYQNILEATKCRTDSFTRLYSVCQLEAASPQCLTCKHNLGSDLVKKSLLNAKRCERIYLWARTGNNYTIFLAFQRIFLTSSVDQ